MVDIGIFKEILQSTREYRFLPKFCMERCIKIFEWFWKTLCKPSNVQGVHPWPELRECSLKWSYSEKLDVLFEYHEGTVSFKNSAPCTPTRGMNVLLMVATMTLIFRTVYYGYTLTWNITLSQICFRNVWTQTSYIIYPLHIELSILLVPVCAVFRLLCPGFSIQNTF